MTLEKDIRYLIKALRSYREVSYGQFDTEYEYEVEETQDAADMLERLWEEREAVIQELEKGHDRMENRDPSPEAAAISTVLAMLRGPENSEQGC